MNILITSAGKRVSLVRAFQFELKTLFPKGAVYTTDMCPELSAACMVSDGHFKVSNVYEENYIEQLLDICKKNGIGMIVPTIDTELKILSAFRDEFLRWGIRIIVSSGSFVDICRDKRKTAEFFKAHEMKTPIIMDKKNPQYPVFVKPYNGSLSSDIHIVKSEEEMRPEYYSDERYLFMEYCSKDFYDEYTVDMYYDSESICRCIVPRKRISVRAGEINKGMTCKNVIVDYLKTRMARVEGAIGCITAQFFLHKNMPVISGIEINARFGGGYPLSYHAGANYPLWLIREYFLQEPVPFFDNWQDNLLMLRYDDEVIIHANKYQPTQLLHL